MCIRSKVMWKPISISQKWPLAQPLVHHLAGSSSGTSSRRRQKIIDRMPPTSTKWKCATTKYELCSCQSNGDTDRMMPVSPAMSQLKRKPIEKIMGVAKRTRPPQMVASQLKILMPVGTEMIIVASVKKVLWPGAHADGEHVVRPHAEAV